MKTTPNNPKELARLLKIAGEENRLRLLCAIFSGKKMCVTELAKKLNLSVAVVSHHLQVMGRAGLLRPVRNGKAICYELPSSDFASDLKGLICKYK